MNVKVTIVWVDLVGHLQIPWAFAISVNRLEDRRGLKE